MEYLSAIYAQLTEYRSQWGHVVDIFLVVLAVAAINLALRLLFNYLEHRVKDSPSIWDDAFYNSLNSPVRALVWIIGLSIAAHIGNPPEDSLVVQFLDEVQLLASAGVVIWFLMRLISEVRRGIRQRSIQRGEPIDETTADAIAKLLQASVWVTALLVVLQSFGVSISGLLAFGGIGGLAVGFAAKDMLANILGGLTIYLSRPFSVGEWVQSPDKDIQGVVEDIGWRATTLRRFDMRVLYVPNAIFSTVALENPSRMTHRRIYEVVGLRYDDIGVVGQIVTDIRQMLDDSEEIDSNQVILVNLNSFGAHSVELMLYCYTVTTSWVTYLDVKQDVLMRAHEIIAGHGAKIALPTRTLHVPEGLQVIERDLRDDAPSEGTPPSEADHG